MMVSILGQRKHFLQIHLYWECGNKPIEIVCFRTRFSIQPEVILNKTILLTNNANHRHFKWHSSYEGICISFLSTFVQQIFLKKCETVEITIIRNSLPMFIDASTWLYMKEIWWLKNRYENYFRKRKRINILLHDHITLYRFQTNNIWNHISIIAIK